MTEASGETGQGGSGSRDVALKLMRMALALLDGAGEPVAAARLQHAIDCVPVDGADVVRLPASLDDDRMWSIVMPLPDRSTRS